LRNGFGGHRIEGIGDKHVPWVHNVKNTNVVTAIDDEDTMRLFRMFNEKEGQAYLKSKGIDSELIEKLPLLGVSSVANLLSAIKTAKYFEYNQDDVIFTVATDSAEMYGSRLDELNAERGKYTSFQAAIDDEVALTGQSTDNMKELNYLDQKSIHNLKYFTWIEQQAKPLDELNQMWYDRLIWDKVFHQTQRWDELIEDFNERTGLLK
jgi:hypothetical protein